MRSGRHEEFRNGPEVKIYIWEVLFLSPEKFRGHPVLYRDHRKGPGGPPGGATYPGGARGLKWEGNQPLVGWCAPLGPLLCLGSETLGGGGAPHLPWGALHPLATAPLGDCISQGWRPPWGPI